MFHYSASLVAMGISILLYVYLQVYKSFPYYPTNGSFDPQLSLSAEDVTFLKYNGFSAVRLYVAWPGVEPSKGAYNNTYLDVRQYLAMSNKYS